MQSSLSDAILRSRPAVQEIARRTPVLSSRTFSERAGGEVLLKAENLQRTGSFKVRGAAAKLAALGDACGGGVVCASAGNHGQGVAAAAAARGVGCTVYVPADAPIAKVEAIIAQGATVERGGAGIAECVTAAKAAGERENLAFVHPYDDLDVIAGQGSVGLELLEDVPDLGKVVVPVGGGGLASGIAIAIKSARPDVQVVGVRADAAPDGVTIADGIAVKRPGAVTQPLLDTWLDDLVTVSEDEIAEAMFLCLERAKLVVEGAGAAGVAALLSARTAPHGITVAILSGGNVDAGLLAEVGRRHESLQGRRLVLMTRLNDRPGELAGLLEHVAGTGANIVDVSHVREGVALHVRETAVELVLETRGREHARAVLDALSGAGYAADVLS
ncbi:MAG: threonine dehydratase [Solirubrobacteraceae bacterium]|nr:threonine dehydratase [Solirubrobacteraceae bacterium]